MPLATLKELFAILVTPTAACRPVYRTGVWGGVPTSNGCASPARNENCAWIFDLIPWTSLSVVGCSRDAGCRVPFSSFNPDCPAKRSWGATMRGEIGGYLSPSASTYDDHIPRRGNCPVQVHPPRTIPPTPLYTNWRSGTKATMSSRQGRAPRQLHGFQNRRPMSNEFIEKARRAVPYGRRL